MNKAGRKKTKPEGWRWMRLGDISDIISGQSPTSDTYRKKPEGLPFYQGKTDFGLRSPTARVWCVAPKKIAMPGDILISVRAPVGPTNVADVECCIGRGLAIIRCKKNVDAHFVLSFLKFAEEKISQIGTGSVFNSINRNDLLNLQILLPPLAEQKAIAEMLSSLDDKIDLLHRQNKTLEDMAQTLFRQWFIKQADKRWKKKHLGETVDIAIGRTPPRKEFEWFSKESGDWKWISIKDMAESGIYLFDTSEYLTQQAVDRFAIRIIPANTVILSFKMTVGRVGITAEDMLSNEAIAHFAFNHETPYSREYLYFYLKTFRFASLGSTSSIVTSINTAMIKSMMIAIPDMTLMKRFESAVKPLFNKIKSNQHSIYSLMNLRDALLPKLISGKVSLRP